LAIDPARRGLINRRRQKYRNDRDRDDYECDERQQTGFEVAKRRQNPHSGTLPTLATQDGDRSSLLDRLGRRRAVRKKLEYLFKTQLRPGFSGSAVFIVHAAQLFRMAIGAALPPVPQSSSSPPELDQLVQT
jgi:hypothetical protein